MGRVGLHAVTEAALELSEKYQLGLETGSAAGRESRGRSDDARRDDEIRSGFQNSLRGCGIEGASELAPYGHFTY